jgi:UDP-GlcNAc:undecaprenyl-phosphate GlcNAc-1-phosphate transferase
MPLRLIATFVAAFAVSAALVPLFRALSIRLGRVAQPREDRWHRSPVALFGGVAIGCTVFGLMAVLGVAGRIPVLTFAAFAMFIVGLTDDVLSLKPATKLVAQIACASILLFFDYRLNWLQSLTFDWLLTLFWVVGMSNAFNLLDNMDGLCAGTAIIVGASLLLEGVPARGTPAFAQAQYLAALVGATGGFLVYNVHPATIFMGDSGSLLLGFSFGALTLTANNRGAPTGSSILSIVAAPVLVLLLPIFDTTLVTVSRMLSGRSASQGGRDHSSHRLVAIGLSERRAVLVLWTLAAAGGAIGIVLRHVNQSWSVLIVAAFLVGMTLFAVYLGRIRVYERDAVNRSTVTPILVDFMYKRRVAEVLLDFFLVTAAYYAAYRLRFEDPEDFMKNFENFLRSLPVVLAVQMVAFFAVGVYRGVWRHFSITDAVTVGRGVFFGVLTTQLVILYAYRFFSYSRTVFVIYGVLLLIAVVLSRASFRLVGEFVQGQRSTGKRVLIYGAGDAGTVVLSELLSAGRGDSKILGFVDDDPRKAGIRVRGYPVVGGFGSLGVLVATQSVDLVVISTKHLTPDRLHNLEVLCAEHGVPLSRLHLGLEDVVSEAPSAELRDTTRPVIKFKPNG